MINLDRLRALHAVDRHGSVVSAAEALQVTPSAVSQQVAKLEREVGEALLDRVGRGVRLTEPGRLLADRAAEVLRLIEDMEGELDERRGAVFGAVRIAAYPTALRGLGPPLLHRLGAHPDLVPELIEIEPDDALPLLTRGMLDVVIAQDWFNAPLVVPAGLERLALFDDVADVALPADHPFAGRSSIPLGDLADERWVTWPEDSVCGSWLVHTMRSLGHEPDVAHTAQEHASQLALVAAGAGAAVIPRLGLDHVPDGVALVPVEPTVTRHLFAVWRPDSARRTAVQAVCRALAAIAATWPAT